MTATTILDNPVAHGNDPKKIPGWVARTPAAQTKVAGQLQSGTPAEVAVTPAVPVVTAPPVAQATKVAEDVQAPIVEDAEPVRLKPSLPAQPQQAKPAVNVLGPALDVPSQAVNAPSQAVNEQRQAADAPGQRPRVTEQPEERPGIAFIGGRPSPRLGDSWGKTGRGLRVGGSGGLSRVTASGAWGVEGGPQLPGRWWRWFTDEASAQAGRREDHEGGRMQVPWCLGLALEGSPGPCRWYIEAKGGTILCSS